MPFWMDIFLCHDVQKFQILSQTFKKNQYFSVRKPIFVLRYFTIGGRRHKNAIKRKNIGIREIGAGGDEKIFDAISSRDFGIFCLRRGQVGPNVGFNKRGSIS